MAARGVRIAPPAGEPPALRRRPRQSRAQASSQALQDAFVRVLLESGYEKTTVREVAAVAGVGVGTFYEYFGNMRALAALCVHQRIKALAQASRQAAGRSAGAPLARVVDAQLDVQVGTVVREAPVWAALFLLERKVSTAEAFRRQYEAYVQVWHAALAAAADPPADAQGAARMLHTMTYGWVSQSLLSCGTEGAEGVDGAALRAELGRAAQAYAAALSRARI